MTETVIICITAIFVALILAGGLNRAFYYLSAMIIAYLDSSRKPK